MCGISGFSGSDNELIKQMNFVNRYRGPDDSGVYVDDAVSLGHTRLSILDLSASGHQPMEYKNLVITYNGEVYNYREIRGELIDKGYSFTSDCDTEVVLKAYDAYGSDCFSMFDGMWAFCIYDREKKTLCLCRDLFGIKPLYYYAKDGQFIFSSMINAILCHTVDTGPNNKIIMDYLSFSLLHHTNETLYENINRLESGCWMEYNLNDKSHSIKRWYVQKDSSKVQKIYVADADSSSSVVEAKVTSDVRRLFEKSVCNRTLADVNIGSCLSGGIDSSSIVCILNKHLEEQFPTFSLIVPNFRLDESKYIKEVGRNTNTIQYTVEITPEIFLEHVSDFIKTHEEPVLGISVFGQYMVMKLASEHGIKVVIDGQGGDEVFTGYDDYYANYFYDLFSSWKFVKLISIMLTYYKNQKSILPHKLFAYRSLPMFVKRALFYKYIVPWVNKSYHTSIVKKPYDVRWKNEGLGDIMDLTMRHTNIPQFLIWEDSNSMRWGIESRPPFLDKELYEYAQKIPSGLLIRDGKTKYCLRLAMKDVLPEMIYERTDKVGFAAPSNQLLRDERVIAFTDSVIYSETFKNRPYWKYDKVVALYEKHKAGKANVGDRIWRLVNLNIWLDEIDKYMACNS